MGIRIVKALVLAMIMYFSLRFLGVSAGASLALSLIPSVLGTLNIMAGPAYAITAIIFILACSSTLIPETGIDLDGVVKVVSPLLKKFGLAA